jgi:hypothetical protein
MKITSKSRLPFGKYKNRKLRDIPTSYLEWLVNNLNESDFHQWAQAAKNELEAREKDSSLKSLEEQADDFLRQYGVDPKKYR